MSRGFDTSLGYAGKQEDHYTQRIPAGTPDREEEAQTLPYGCDGVDLFEGLEPALGKNGTYSTITYTQRAVSIVRAHDASAPLFLYVGLQGAHRAPLPCTVAPTSPPERPHEPCRALFQWQRHAAGVTAGPPAARRCAAWL